MKKDKSELLGQIMLATGLINESQLEDALREKEKTGGYLGETLVKLGYIGKDDLSRCLREQLGASVLITLKDLDSPEASEFYRLQTALKFALFADEPIKTLMVTSSVPSEGKSTCIGYLALAFSSVMESNTLLVDADLRRPSLHSRFGLSSSSLGLTDLLVDGTVRLESCLKDTEITNLKLLPCGSRPPNPTALLASRKMLDLIEDLKTRFDLILFDSPSLFPVADASLLSSYVDGTIFVIQAGSTRRSVVQRGVNILKDSQTKILGVILNQIENEMPRYIYEHYGAKGVL